MKQTIVYYCTGRWSAAVYLDGKLIGEIRNTSTINWCDLVRMLGYDVGYGRINEDGDSPADALPTVAEMDAAVDAARRAKRRERINHLRYDLKRLEEEEAKDTPANAIKRSK